MRFRRFLKAHLRFLACLVLLMGLKACFNERSPKKPEENTDWISPTEPQLLIDNFRKAMTTVNLNNFRRCVVPEKFRFQADPTIQANNPGLFANWTWDNENQFFNNLNLFAQPINSANNLVFSNVRIINANQDSLEYTADYVYSVYHQDTRFQAVTFAGLASFQLRRNRQNEWQIVTWQDNKTKENPCWTELRRHFFAP